MLFITRNAASRKVKKYEKNDPLWEYAQGSGKASFSLSFAEIKEILGFEIDHSFLNYKKELAEYGYTVGKISLKEKKVMFAKTQADQ